MITYAKVALILLQLAQRFFALADKQELRDEGYQKAVADAGAETLRVVGISAQSFGEAAGWTEEQIEDVLTRPPSPAP